MLQFESRIPSVSVVIATNGKRMQSLRTAVTAILDQQYPGPVEVVIVYDRATPDPLSDIEISENRSLRIIENTRTGGLAGARNSGILEATGIILGFCDDDDTWMPGKLTEQVALWRANPDAVGISSGITVRSDGRNIVRLAPERATFDDFLRSRITEVHPSAMLYSRSDLVDGPVGLVDEQLPASYGEDYDLLLRATKHGDILSVPQPLVRVLWDRPSFFAGQWQYIADGLTYCVSSLNLSVTPRVWRAWPGRWRSRTQRWAIRKRHLRLPVLPCTAIRRSCAPGPHTRWLLVL